MSAKISKDAKMEYDKHIRCLSPAKKYLKDTLEDIVIGDYAEFNQQAFINSSAKKPFRMKIRNICGNETVWEV